MRDWRWVVALLGGSLAWGTAGASPDPCPDGARSCPSLPLTVRSDLPGPHTWTLLGPDGAVATGKLTLKKGRGVIPAVDRHVAQLLVVRSGARSSASWIEPGVVAPEVTARFPTEPVRYLDRDGRPVVGMEVGASGTTDDQGWGPRPTSDDEVLDFPGGASILYGRISSPPDHGALVVGVNLLPGVKAPVQDWWSGELIPDDLRSAVVGGRWLIGSYPRCHDADTCPPKPVLVETDPAAKVKAVHWTVVGPQGAKQEGDLALSGGKGTLPALDRHVSQLLIVEARGRTAATWLDAGFEAPVVRPRFDAELVRYVDLASSPLPGLVLGDGVATDLEGRGPVVGDMSAFVGLPGGVPYAVRAINGDRGDKVLGVRRWDRTDGVIRDPRTHTDHGDLDHAAVVGRWLPFGTWTFRDGDGVAIVDVPQDGDIAQRPAREWEDPNVVYGGVFGGVVGEDPPPLVALTEDPVTVHSSELEATRQTPPAFPKAAKDLGLNNVRCKVRVVADASGTPTSVQMLDCPDLFRDSVQTGLLDWRWQPLVRDGRAVPFQTVITVVFRLAD